MIVPDVNSIKLKFPEFASVAPAAIELAIEEAVVCCGGGDWINDANQTLALMYYTAHLLEVQRVRAQSAGGQLIKSERIGELAMTYEVPQQPTLTDVTDLNSTTYGVRYLGLVARNIPAVLVVGSAVRM